MRQLLILMALFFLFATSVLADFYMPFAYTLQYYNVILFIPVILLETCIAFFFVKHVLEYDFTFKRWLLILLVANIVSFVFGAIWEMFSHAVFENTVLTLVSAYFFSILTEFLPIHFFARKKFAHSLTASLVIAFMVNTASYLFLFLILAQRFGFFV